VSNIRTTTAMLLRAAILPEDMVRHLVLQGQLPPGVLAVYGQEVPKSEKEKVEWLQKFGVSLDDQEMEVIKETMLDDPGIPVEVGVYPTLERALAADTPSERVALQDQFGRMCFDIADGGIAEGEIIEVLGVDPRQFLTVIEVEPLYQDDEEKFLVCRVEILNRTRNEREVGHAPV